MADEAKTREAIDADGWLHTGDVATLDGAGRFRIVDRVKNIMKLAQGEYVALENVENIYSGAPIVAQLYVHGDSLQSYLIAVVVPDPVQFAALASRVRGGGAPIAPDDAAALAAAAKDPRVVAAVHDELQKMAHKQQLKGCVSIDRSSSRIS